MSLSGKPLSRRRVLVLSAGAIAAPALLRGSPEAIAADESETHGISFFGDLKYPADFKRFDYVNPNAPKGGVFSETIGSRLFNQNFNTFNSLNSFILKGDAAKAMELTFASLMSSAQDERDALYGLAADRVRISATAVCHSPAWYAAMPTASRTTAIRDASRRAATACWYASSGSSSSNCPVTTSRRATVSAIGRASERNSARTA